MTKTIRIMARAVRTLAVHAVLVALVGGAGWLYVRGLIWLARAFHRIPHTSWEKAISDTVLIGLVVFVVIGAACWFVHDIVAPAVADYFTGVWRRAAEDVAAEEVSEEARETLLRGSGKR